MVYYREDGGSGSPDRSGKERQVRYRFLIALIIAAFLTAAPAFAAPVRLVQTRGVSANAEQPPPITILSIIPAQGEPGSTVTLAGAGFSEKTTVFLGSQEVPTRVAGSRQLSFDIPKLPAGLYAMFLKREDGTVSRSYNFTLLPAKPVALSLAPDRIYACASGREREVTVTGRNFQPGSQLLFDGAAIRSIYNSPENLSFAVPPVAGGLHQVQIINREETVSAVLAFFVETKPEIESITQGNDYVTYYELLINGRNFQQGATLMVDNQRLTVGTSNMFERDQVVYLDCTRIVYQRHPYDFTAKSFRVQVVNPSSEASNAVQVTAP